MNNLVLSLFPGIGLLDRGWEEEGWCVVRGPDVLWGGDVRQFHPPAGCFGVVIGGPPCQDFSIMGQWLKERETFGNLIPEFERCVAESEPDIFVMENVGPASVPVVPGYVVESGIFNNRQFGGEQNRERRLSVGARGRQPLILRSLAEWAPVNGAKSNAVVGGHTGKGAVAKFSTRDMARLQGLPDDWLKHNCFLDERLRKMLGNGVPLPMGRAIARAVRRAMLQGAGSLTE